MSHIPFLVCVFQKTGVFSGFRWFSVQYYIGKRLTCQAVAAISCVLPFHQILGDFPVETA